MSHGKDISFKDWAEDEGMKHGDVPITDWAQHEEESHDARYGAETQSLDSGETWKNRNKMSYFFVMEQDGRGIYRHKPYRTKDEAIQAGEKPDEIYEYRGVLSLSKEEDEKQKKDRSNWRKKQINGEFFKDFWWKGEMSRYANSDDGRLHHSLYDSSTENDEKDDFYAKTILPRKSSFIEQETNLTYANRLGISEMLGALLNSSRTFGMYITQRQHPDTVNKYRQKIISGFDSYKPQSEKEKKIVEIVRENMATRGVKGPSPSYWSTTQGVLRKPELSYVYDDYYDNPIPFMGYELTDAEKKIIGDVKNAEHSNTIGFSQKGFWKTKKPDANLMPRWSEKLTRKERKKREKEAMENGTELDFPYVDASTVAMITKIVDGEPMRGGSSNVSMPRLELPDTMTMTWGEIKALGKEQRTGKNWLGKYEYETTLGDSKYPSDLLDRAFKKLPTDTVMKIQNGPNYPAKITFEYGGDEWMVYVAPRVDTWGAENWGGDPKGKLAVALQKARDKSKEPKKPLKIEKLDGESFSAPRKGIDTFSKPFEEASLDSGGMKKWIVAATIGGLAYLGYKNRK